MHVLFEDEGELRAGTVRATAPASLQVETTTGRRVKVRAASVLLHFDDPSPLQLLERARADSEAIDIDFLWQCAPREEFAAGDLAREYHGRDPAATETAAILLRLHASPVYFHRRGKGRFRPAPPEILEAALAGIARRRRQEEERERMSAELVAGALPAAIAAAGIDLLVDPDRNSIEWKALEQAARECRTTPLRLMLERGAIASPWHWHVESFLRKAYPRGTGFSIALPAPPAHDERLPLAPAPAFSIDDSDTTEIDDAFSVAATAGGWRLGIHIAAPAIALARDHPVDGEARARMSTLYAPGMKVTMLPPAWIDAFSLVAGRTVPVVSLYFDVEGDALVPGSWSTRLERVAIAANLRHDRLDSLVTEEGLDAGGEGLPFGSELARLWRLSGSLQRGREAVRGRPEPRGRVDTTFRVQGEGPAARVELVARRRDAPLDRIVSELMILANCRWGAWLDELGLAGIFRSQSQGRVRMATVAGPHEGLGVSHYAWCTSPLRRYADLVNQRQILAALAGTAPAMRAREADLYAALSAFDATYASLGQFQERMERYWCLRWLVQEERSRGTATVVRGDLVRLDDAPLYVRLGGEGWERGRRMEIAWEEPDLVELSLFARCLRLLEDAAPANLPEDEGEGEETPVAAVAAAEGAAGPA